MRPNFRRYLRLLPALSILAIGPGAAVDVGADDFRISAMGGTGNTTYEANRPAVAYNPIDDEYLVVWAADSDQPPFADGAYGIFGQRIDGTTGAELGTNDFAITGVIGGFGGPFNPRVVFNADLGEYYVVWIGVTGLCCGLDYEAYGRRVAANGTPLGVALQISHMASDIDEHSYIAQTPDVVYNPTAAEYLVVWSGDDGAGGLVNDELEIFGQRISAATGAAVGTDDFRISTMGANGSAFYDATEPTVAYNEIEHEYLVVWVADQDQAPLADNENEVYGQRLDSSSGAELGADDFRFTSIGPDGDANWLVIQPDVAYDPLHNQYLVAFTAAESAPAVFTWALDIFIQRLDATGAEIGADDAQITDVGVPLTTFNDAEGPEVAFDSVSGNFLVTYYANDDAVAPSGGWENYVQELTWNGLQVGPNDDPVSDMGPPDSNQFEGIFPAIATNSSNGEALVVWRGDDNVGGLVNSEYEIFGQRIRTAGIFSDAFESGDPGRWSATEP